MIVKSARNTFSASALNCFSIPARKPGSAPIAFTVSIPLIASI